MAQFDFNNKGQQMKRKIDDISIGLKNLDIDEPMEIDTPSEQTKSNTVKGRFKIIDKVPEEPSKFSIKYLRELNKKMNTPPKDTKSTSWTQRTSSTSTSSTISK